MMFASRVAENANRRSRLIFQTPPNVPAPSTTERDGIEADGFPTISAWMENGGNPFGTDVFIPPLRIPSTDSSSASSSSSRPDGKEKTNADPTASRSSGLAQFKTGKPEESRFKNHAAGTERTIGSADTSADIRSIPVRDNSSASAKPSILPVPAILLAGKNSMSKLSALANGVLVNCIPNGTNANNGAVTVSVALPKASARARGMETQLHQSQSMLYKSDDLYNVDIPQAPFDPFGSLSGSREGDNVPAMSSLSDVHLSEDDNNADDERLDSRSRIDDSCSEAEDVTDTKNGLGAKEMKARKYLGVPLNNMAKITRKDTGLGVGAFPASSSLSHPRAVASTPTVHHSFFNLRCRPTVASTREAQSERGRRRLSTSNDDASFLTQVIAATTADDVGKKDAHLSGTTAQTQTDGSPSITSHSASHHVNNDAPPGTESQPSNVAELEKQKQKQEEKIHKSFGKSMMNKIRKLGHSKKRAQ